MLGYLIYPTKSAPKKRVMDVLGGFRSIAPLEWLEMPETSVLVYQTPHANNYRLVSPRGRTFVACGTILLGESKGLVALEEVAARFERAEELRSIYKDLRGPYNLLIVEPESQSLHVVTDREGLMCSYAQQYGSGCAISSSLLLLAALSATALDPLGVQEFVHGGATIRGRTSFSGVRKTPGGTYHRIRDGVHASEKLWSPTIRYPYLPDSDDQIVENLFGLFSRVLRVKPADGTKTFGVDLTAGTDSHTVLSFLLRAGNPVVASTAGPTGHVDVVRAQELARIAGIEHFWFPTEDTIEFDAQSLETCVEYDDGVQNLFGLTKLVSYFAEKATRFDMLFGGNGGPLFKDHYWLFEFNRIDQPREPNWNRIARYSLTEHSVNPRLFVNGIDYVKHMAREFQEHSEQLRGTNNQKLDFVYFDVKCQGFHAPQFSLANRFLDVYHPLVDGELVEYSANIRPWIRQRARLQSELIYLNSPALAWVPTDNLVPCVPDNGVHFYLRALRGVRYARALRRKTRDFILGGKRIVPDNRSLTLVGNLKKASLWDQVQHPETLRIAPQIDGEEVMRLGAAAEAGGHSGYLQRIMSVELSVRKVEALSGRRLEVPALRPESSDSIIRQRHPSPQLSTKVEQTR